MPELSDSLLKLCNQQIDNELNASHLYLAMSAWFEAEDLPGMAAWMRAQSDEERAHALKFYDHISERDSRVTIGAVDEPQASWDNPLSAFEAAYEHEKKVTGQIYDIYKAAEEENDYALQNFLDWFVEEQVEEEHSTQHVVELLRRVGGDPYRLYKVDRSLAARDE